MVYICPLRLLVSVHWEAAPCWRCHRRLSSVWPVLPVSSLNLAQEEPEGSSSACFLYCLQGLMPWGGSRAVAARCSPGSTVEPCRSWLFQLESLVQAEPKSREPRVKPLPAAELCRFLCAMLWQELAAECRIQGWNPFLSLGFIWAHQRLQIGLTALNRSLRSQVTLSSLLPTKPQGPSLFKSRKLF